MLGEGDELSVEQGGEGGDGVGQETREGEEGEAERDSVSTAGETSGRAEPSFLLSPPSPS